MQFKGGLFTNIPVPLPVRSYTTSVFRHLVTNSSKIPTNGQAGISIGISELFYKNFHNSFDPYNKIDSHE